MIPRSLPLLLLLLPLLGCPTPVDDDDASGDCDVLGGDEQPTVIIDDPDNGTLLDDDDPINWVVRVEDPDGDPSGATLEALDLSDGTPQDIDYAPPSPGTDGRATFGMPGGTLGTGVITVRIVATDEQGCTGDDQIFVCIGIPEGDCPAT